ncbi:tetratricopeptide repeat protein [Streptomyces virginiae]|uniref:tetratricopeptide repeat protein n=1 Tax=Streptomyces virginiae TaxID=1961 RepID=UPI003864B4D6|nr:tetratricopeptide repeat protein [Streptomyces virginiae]
MKLPRWGQPTGKGSPPATHEPSEPSEPSVYADRGSLAAGRDILNSVALYVENGTILPQEAYGPIADVQAPAGLCNAPATKLFVGRAEVLTLLDAAFATPGEVVVQAVHGLGGIGKSSLAAQWARRHHTGNPRWWITADSPEAIDAGLAELARSLQPALAVMPPAFLVERALQWLTTHDDWLIVLDNVERPGDITALLDRVGTGRFLVTTRRATGWHHTATSVRLDVLAHNEALDLFVRVLTDGAARDTAGAAEVCSELGHLPLAVELAAAYCAETGTSPRDYLDMLALRPAATLAAGIEDGDPDRTISRAWRITLDTLAATPLAVDVLRILAWYAPTHIPRNLLTPLAEAPELPTAIGRLTAHSMITDNHDGTLAVHRLVQTLARTPDPVDDHRQPEAVDQARDRAAELLADAFPSDVKDPANWATYRALHLHTDALTSHHTPDHDTIHTALALTYTANYRREQGALTHAIEDFLRALSTFKRLKGEDHHHTLHARNNLAGAYESVGDLGRAIPMYERTLADCERVQGDDHPDTLISRNNLAGAYRSVGDLGRAIPMHERTLADCQRVLGDDHPDTLTSRNNLAYAYESAGDLGRAIPMYERTLADRERVLGDDHYHTLDARNNLAGAYRSVGDLGRAIPLFERTLADCERVLGDDHPDTLTSRNNLAYAYRSVGDLGRAIPLFERTLADRERVQGDDHPDTLNSRNNLAGTYRSVGDLGRAIPLFERTLADRERVQGDDHPDTLNSRNNLAYVYESAGDLEQAIPLFERTLADRERVLGDDHPATLTSRNNLAGTYESAGDLERAIPLFERTLADRERVQGDDHPDTLTSRNNLAYVYESAGDLEQAIPLYERTLADSERVLGDDHPDTLNSRNNLAGAYESAGDLEQAIPLYERILADSERVLGSNPLLTEVVRANLEAARSALRSRS